MEFALALRPRLPRPPPAATLGTLAGTGQRCSPRLTSPAAAITPSVAPSQTQPLATPVQPPQERSPVILQAPSAQKLWLLQSRVSHAAAETLNALAQIQVSLLLVKLKLFSLHID